MDDKDIGDKIKGLARELESLQGRLKQTKAKSSDIFVLGGDGWHDNPAYDLMIADIDKLSSLYEEVKKEMIDLQKGVDAPRAIMVHGTKGHPSGNWFPWLAKELERAGWQVIRPQFPTPENQTVEGYFKVWRKEVGRSLGKDVYVGHSSGPAFLLRVLEKNARPIRAAFFVAPFIRDLGDEEFDRLNGNFYRDPFNWDKIKQNCERFFVYASDDDPYVPLARSREMADCLGASLTLVKGAKHFSAENNYWSFPRLLEDILAL